MSKSLRKPGKKTFVRNTEQKIPKVTVKTQVTTSKSASISEPVENKASKKSTCEHQEKPIAKYDVPQANSSKNITETIKKIKNVKLSEVKQQKNNGLIEEKITKKMNFPIDKSVYKDLVPLCVKTESVRVTTSRDPLPPKDVEPSLSDFYKPEPLPEYVFKSEPERFVPLRKISGNVKFDGFKITRHIETWDEAVIIKKFQ